MLKLNHINLDKNPALIQPPQVDDNMVVLALLPDTQEIIKADILDVALSYSIAGIDVVLEMAFDNRNQFNNKHLASLICNGGWSLSLLAPEPEPRTKSNKEHQQTPTVKDTQPYNKKPNQQPRLKYAQDYTQEHTQDYVQHVIEWYQLWRSPTMRSFDKALYPITPYLEYLTTHYLIDKNKQDLNSKDTQALIRISKNPTNPYLLNLIKNMEPNVVNAFKQQLKGFIDKQDTDFYQDIDLLTNQVTKAQC